MDEPPTKSRGESDLIALLRVLSEHRVDYVVCGGVACVFHGVARVTHDLDLCVNMEDANLRRLVDASRTMGLAPRIPEPLDALLDPARRRAWIEEERARVFTLVSLDSPLQFDVILEYPVPYEALRQRACVIAVGDVTFPISSVQDLINAKRAVHPRRRVDERDIEDLEELSQREPNAGQSER